MQRNGNFTLPVTVRPPGIQGKDSPQKQVATASRPGRCLPGRSIFNLLLGLQPCRWGALNSPES